MTNFYLLIIGYFLIFLSLILSYYRLKKINLTEEDYQDIEKIDKFFRFLKDRFLYFLKLSEKEVVLLWYNFIEKILRRIKIEGLKIETWASRKLEELKSRKEKQ